MPIEIIVILVLLIILLLIIICNIKIVPQAQGYGALRRLPLHLGNRTPRKDSFRGPDQP